ncbi:MAG: prolyl oligopeptidase family serine peptidase [Puia sp.]|nr:prolyl oligopeptidase family serine peptidase [Puia sp.]
MKYFICFLFFGAFRSTVLAQRSNNAPSKKVIDSPAIMNWPNWGSERAISNNGRYFVYSQYALSDIAGELIIQATDNSWRRQLHGISDGYFSSDSKLFVFRSNDTLYLMTLGTEKVRSLSHILSFKISKSGKWLAYVLSNGSGDLVIDKLSTGEEKHFTGVQDFSFSPNEQVMLLRTGADKNSCDALEWADLSQGILKTIWKIGPSENNISLNGYSFGESGNSLVFSLHSPSDTSQKVAIAEGMNTIWYYNSTTSSAIVCIKNGIPGIPHGFFIGRSKPALSSNENFILFGLDSAQKKPEVDERAVQVDIWSYQDSVLQYNQSNDMNPASYLGSFNLKTNHIVRLIYNDEGKGANFGDYVVVTDKMSITDYWWPSYKQKVSSLVSLTDGSRMALGDIANPVFLKKRDLVVFYDYGVHHYYSLDLKTGRKQNISWSIPGNWLEDQRSWVWDWRQRAVLGIAGVFADDKSVLVYDGYDIWELDVDGVKTPINITNGYGRRSGINYRLINQPQVMMKIENHSVLVLSTFNTLTKYNGFSRIDLDRIADPRSLSVGPWTMYRGSPAVAEQYGGYGDDMPPLKALDTSIWIVKRETATESPNYFLTSDFIHYAPLTDNHPQQAFNWMTTELVRWKQLDGTYSEGVLYKPENFDPRKKYPVIFYYYEELSQNMYVCQVPDFDGATVNIPWYVSRGYLVFTPDIHYSIASISGKVNGDCVVNSVVSAARYLSGRPYVDARRMGIQGHSFGGGETLYLVTHSHLFAAACSASATISNEITAYLGFTRVKGKIVSQKMDHSEDGHEKIGTTLWQRPDLYIRASPVFRANQVTTPLLIMANLGDQICDWGQGAEMYMALRRLHKKVWMLQYDKGNHAVNNEDAIDYAIRMNQFFDFYLKGALPPRWMTKGIPAYLKGIETGYELDESGAQP